MGLFSLLGKTAIAIATNLDKVDSISDIVEKLPDTFDKAKETAGKIKDMASSANLDLYIKQQEKLHNKEDIKKGIENEAMVKILPEMLFEFEYSISPKYNFIKEINNDFFVARDNDKYGVIDINNNIVLPFEYDNIENLGDGLFPVKKDGKYGFVNTKNEVVIDFVFSDAGPFSFGMAPVQKCVQKTSDESGNLTQEYITSWGYIDKSGEYIISPKYYSAEPFNKFGLAIVERYRGNNLLLGASGVINIDDTTIVACDFSSIDIYNDCIECFPFGGKIRGYYYDFNGNPISEADVTLRKKIHTDNKRETVWCDEKNSYMQLSDRKIFLYNNSKNKHGLYENIEGNSICRIEPIFDNDIIIRYTETGEKYSIIEYGGLYGIIKIKDKEAE